MPAPRRPVSRIASLCAAAFVAASISVCGLFPSDARALVRGDDFSDYILDDRLSDRHTIWYRIRRDTRMQLPKVNKWIDREIKRYQRSPRYLKRLLTRSAPYIHYVTEVLHKNGLPLDLALLPVVESGYDPFAYSAGSASGMWQFIGSTARLYGIEINWWYDGRRDVVASTQAAVRFLRDLYGYAKGDWSHALAAYNAGWAAVSRRIDRNRRHGRSVEFWHLSLPRETRDYVPRFYALAHIVNNPDKYNLSLPPIPNRRVLSFVDVGSQIDLARAADLANLPPTVLYKINPGFNRWASPPQGPHVLAVPATHESVFVEAIGALSEKERIRWHQHKVQPGDSISQLASESNTTVDEIARVNDLQDPDDIRAYTNIIIPSAIYPAANYSHSTRLRRLYAQKKARARPGQTKHIHVVKKKDTLWSIARQYDLEDYKQIAKWNKISPKSILRPGQDLLLFLPERDKAVVSPKSRKPVIRRIVYSVRPNDSPARIARRFSVPTKSVLKWNQLSQDSVIHPGQELTLYVNVTGD